MEGRKAADVDEADDDESGCEGGDVNVRVACRQSIIAVDCLTPRRISVSARIEDKAEGGSVR